MATVWQLVADRDATHSVVLPEVNVTVPVAPAGNPSAETVSVDPYTMLAGAADSLSVTVALVTAKLAPVAVVPW